MERKEKNIFDYIVPAAVVVVLATALYYYLPTIQTMAHY